MRNKIPLILIMAVAVIGAAIGYHQIKNHRRTISIPSPQAYKEAVEYLRIMDEEHQAGNDESANRAYAKIVQLVGKSGVASLLNERHNREIAAIDGSTKYIRIGDANLKAGSLEEAVEAYKKAYDLGGDYVASGLQLAATYEQLHRYDDGISILDEMITKGYLSANGVKNANTIKARLIAAKTEN